MLSNKALFVVALCLAVTACGGGGGGGSAPPPISVSPPPPPPPPNMGPSLSINVTPSQINENTSFFIDLSNSTDSDGQIVRASVQQFNPGFYVASLVNAPSSGVGRFEFIAPEVFFHERSGPGVDSEVFFDVEIEDDDGSVVTERVTIIVESVVGANREEGISEFFTLNLAEEVILFSDNTPTPSFNFVFGTRPISNAASGEKQIFLLDGVLNLQIEMYGILCPKSLRTRFRTSVRFSQVCLDLISVRERDNSLLFSTKFKIKFSGSQPLIQQTLKDTHSTL